MHRIFLLDEILRNIFSSFSHSTHSDTYTSRVESAIHTQSLLSLAVTCSGFRDPSLDILWHTLTSITPLLRLLPKNVPQMDGQMIFSQPLNEHDWDRLRTHGPCVRSLRLHCPNDASHGERSPSSFHSAFFRSLQSSYHQFYASPVLPRLRTLRLHKADLSDRDCLSILLSAPLESLEVSFAIRSKSELSLGVQTACELVAQGPAANTLRHLSIPYASTCPHLSQSLLESYISMMQRLQDLRSLQIIQGILHRPDIWDCVARMPLLEVIWPVGNDSYPQPPMTPPDGFLQLREVHGGFPAISELLNPLPIGRISSIRVWQTDSESADDARDFVSLVSQKCPGLKKFIAHWHKVHLPASPPPLTRFLSPVLSNCRQLTHVEIYLLRNVIFDLSNDDYQVICRSWPKLLFFKLSFHIPTHVRWGWKTPRATLQGALDAFAGLCLDLQQLILIQNLVWDAQVETPDKVFSSLKSLDLRLAALDMPGGPPGKSLRDCGDKVRDYLLTVGRNAVVYL